MTREISGVLSLVLLMLALVLLLVGVCALYLVFDYRHSGPITVLLAVGIPASACVALGAWLMHRINRAGLGHSPAPATGAADWHPDSRQPDSAQPDTGA